MPWLYLFLAGLLEVGWVLGLKYADGFTRPLPSIFTAVALIASMGFLGLAIRDLPLGTAYAVWTGIGTLGAAAFGIWLFDEPTSLMRLACIGLIALGIVGLKVTAA